MSCIYHTQITCATRTVIRIIYTYLSQLHIQTTERGIVRVRDEARFSFQVCYSAYFDAHEPNVI
jgi:hypothetical protein